MNNNIKIFHQNNINELSDEKYNDFLNLNPKSNYFQTLDFFTLNCKLKNQSPYLITMEENNKIISSVMGVLFQSNGYLGIKNKLSKRSIIIGGPLFENQESLKFILQELTSFEKSENVIYSEFRNLNNLTQQKKIFEELHWNYLPHLNFIVDINDLLQNKTKISRSKKNQINKSLKNGASIVLAENIEEVESFYSILENLYKTKVKKPLPAFEFFKHAFESKDCKYLLIKYENNVIGGILAPVYKDVIYEWFICGEDGKYKNIYPSVLATWAPIQYAQKNKLSYFDFLGAGKPDEDYGVREFKSKYGGELVEYGRYLRVYKPLIYNTLKKIIKTIEKR